MNVVQEFSRFADQYDSYNIVQKDVAKRLVLEIEKKRYNSVVDIGCGSGTIYKELEKNNVNFNQFIALDFSPEMLSIHPNNKRIQKKCFDFNNINDFGLLTLPKDTLILSSSALQWSTDLDRTLKAISQLGLEFHFSFFTSNTFSTLHQIANIESPIYSKPYLIERLSKYYTIKHVEASYQLRFEKIRQMFRYIKRSGVSGGEKKLSYKEIKKVMSEYPFDYLEFEVLFIEAKKKPYK